MAFQGFDPSILLGASNPNFISQGIAGFQAGQQMGDKFRQRERQANQQQQISDAIGGMEGLTPEMKQLMINDPDIRKMIFTQQIKKQLGTGSGQPASVKEWEYYSKLPPKKQKHYLRMKRADRNWLRTDEKGNSVIIDSDTQTAVPVVIDDDGETPKPLVNPEIINANKKVKQDQERIGIKEKELDLAKDASERADKKLELDEANQKLQEDKNNLSKIKFNNVINEKLTKLKNAQRQLKVTKETFAKAKGAGLGPGQSWIGENVSTDVQKYRSAVRSMSSTLKALTRVAGEGSASDWEGKLALYPLPELNEKEETQQFKIDQLDELFTLIQKDTEAMKLQGKPFVPFSGDEQSQPLSDEEIINKVLGQ